MSVTDPDPDLSLDAPADHLTRSLARVRVVLCEPSSAGNIGATARALRVMGLGDLALVNPVDHLHWEAVSRSAGSEEFLRRATVTETLQEAVADCTVVLGVSRRQRVHEGPPISAREAAAHIADLPVEQRVALVFGQERAGLTSEQIACCGGRLYIPVDPDYRSLNLAAAVQVVCYELRMAHLARAPTPEPEALTDKRLAPADRGEIEGLMAHMHEALVAVGYHDPANPAHRHTLERLRQVYERAILTKEEVHLLRGVQARTLAAVARRGDPTSSTR